LAPEARVVGIAIQGGDLPSLEKFADQMAGVLADLPDRPLLIISSDMSHENDLSITQRQDRVALKALESLDPTKVYHVIANRISMCGVRPAVVVMETLRRLNSLNRFESVGYATSSDAPGGRHDYVVGYAGMLFG
jgi:AmmeMemoRadiSam system protein B